MDGKLWYKLCRNIQSCNKIGIERQCLKKYIRLGLNYPVGFGRKEKFNQFLI